MGDQSDYSNGSKVEHLIQYLDLNMLPLEGTYFKNTYTAKVKLDNNPIATAMIGLFAQKPASQSNFHRLDHDEVWHFYHGDPFMLYILEATGKMRRIRMGSDVLAGDTFQCLVPARTWQAACLLPDSTYALFGCTMSPGFTASCFEAGHQTQLISEYPEHFDIIMKLTTRQPDTRLPDDF